VSISQDPNFRHQFDANPAPDPEVEALLAGIEPQKQTQQPAMQPRMTINESRPEFKWLGMKTLR
jgi:hypothetical protein